MRSVLKSQAKITFPLHILYPLNLTLTIRYPSTRKETPIGTVVAATNLRKKSVLEKHSSGMIENKSSLTPEIENINVLNGSGKLLPPRSTCAF